MSYLWIGGVLVGLTAGGFAWGVVRIRRGVAQAAAASCHVGLSQIPELAAEFITSARDRLGVEVALEKPEAAAQAISDLLDTPEKLKPVFGDETFWWRFVLPAGAVLGEYMRRHAGGKWVVGEEGEPMIRIPVGAGDPAETYPFSKVIKQAITGDEGDVYAYLLSSMQLDRIAEAV